MYKDYSYLREEMYGCETGQQKLPFLPYAHHIINTYIKAPWKNFPNSGDYVIHESQIAFAFLLKSEQPELVNGFEFSLRFLANMLNINPFLLFNDKKLPFYFEPKTRN